MRKYEKPEIEIIEFCLKNTVMDILDYSEGYGDGEGEGDYGD